MTKKVQLFIPLVAELTRLRVSVVQTVRGPHSFSADNSEELIAHMRLIFSLQSDVLVTDFRRILIVLAVETKIIAWFNFSSSLNGKLALVPVKIL